MLNTSAWGHVSSQIYFQLTVSPLGARPFPHPTTLFNRLPRVSPKVTEISMGEFLAHSTAVWLNPHPSLGRIRKDPEMTVFGESRNSFPRISQPRL